MLTKPMQHQNVALRRLRNQPHFGLFMEQGTGKTWCLLADAERLYERGDIKALLVIAPNGVHTNWVRREIPQHMSVPHIARAWKSGAGKRYMRTVEEVLEPKKPLRILSMNIDALITKKGYALAERFVTEFKCMIVIDESTRIKSPDSARNKAVMRLRPHASYVRIMTGTPVTNAPVDVFAQMEFLKLNLLGTSSYRAFVAEYAEIMLPSHPMMQRMIERNPRVARAQVVARDSKGNRIWKNLDKLQQLLEPWTYRVTKAECLDLPPKIYKQHFFDLNKDQQKAYRLMKEECRMEIGEEPLPVQALSMGVKLQQITSGFMLHEGTPHYITKDNARLKALIDLVADIDGQFIVWARFREEIRAIQKAFDANGILCATYCGDTKPAAREAAIDEFQSGAIRAFIGNQQAAGIGLTLTAAQTAIYYSNDFNLEHRLQSEDRCHRKGTKGNVVYIDLVAEGSIDESITNALQSKGDMAAAIVGDINDG